MAGTEVDVTAVNGGVGTDTGIEHGDLLLAFTEAVMRGEPAAAERDRLRAVLSPDSFIDTAAVIGSFNVVDRIADATGIPLDAALRQMSQEVCDQLNLVRFASAANTPG
jgi:hypothetical protein